MASPSVHDATGKKCWGCGKEFSKASFNITMTDPESPKGLVVKRRVCATCHHDHLSRGE